MSFQEEIFDKIEAYLSGELDADEVAAFENQISTDDLLKAEIEKHKVANALIREQRLLSVKNILQEERTKDSNSNNSSNPLGFILLAVAAVGIGVSVWMLNKDDVASSDKGMNTAPQVVSSTGRPGKKVIAENSQSTLQEASKYNAPSEETGFHKQQIQQVEDHLHADEKGVLHIDSSFTPATTNVKTSPNSVTTPISSDKTTTPLDPCLNLNIQAVVKTAASCSHEATGTVFVQNIQGGAKPYSIVLSSTDNDAVTNGELKKGMYQVLVTDANGCVQKYSNITVAEKDCARDYSFNPFMGEKWPIESYKAAGQLEIYNKGGVLYYQTHLQAQEEIEWTGMGIGNQIVPGYYIFVIKYVDGTIKKGSVTIVQ